VRSYPFPCYLVSFRSIFRQNHIIGQP
jgi:hypothetical protein